jgi:GntR family transcriptional regulator
VDIKINVDDDAPIYRQIVNQIRYLIASGILEPDEELPPIRTLAMQLKVTPNTVVKAYGELELAGLVRTRQGSGTFVSAKPSPLADRERKRVIEQRVDALLAEARQLDFPLEDLFKIIHKRHAAMTRQATARGAS